MHGCSWPGLMERQTGPIKAQTFFGGLSNLCLAREQSQIACLFGSLNRLSKLTGFSVSRIQCAPKPRFLALNQFAGLHSDLNGFRSVAQFVFGSSGQEPSEIVQGHRPVRL